jgi:hypothetical protein
MTDRVDTQFKFSAFAVGDTGAKAATTAIKITTPTGAKTRGDPKVNGATQRRPLAEGVPSLLEEFIQKVRSRLLYDVDELLPAVQEAGLLDSTCTFGLTPLMWAASRGDAKIVRLLCDAGARLDVQTADLGEDAFIFATKNGHEVVMRVLLESSAKDGNYRRHGSPLVRHENAAGWTALTFACANAFFEAARLCVAAGASVVHRARDGTTPLTWATTAGNREVVAFLLAAGAKPVTDDVYQSEYLATYMDVSAAKKKS